MNKKKLLAAAAAFGVVASLVAVSPAANAEPVGNGPVIVGSDTLQDVMNALVNGTTVTTPLVRAQAGSSFAASFDATGSTLIQTKSNGPIFGRPNGSGDGVKALSRSIDGANYTAGTKGSPTVKIPGQVDVARSSSSGTANAQGELLYIPFGRDALTYAHSGGANAAFDVLEAATLKGIFECTITEIGGVTVVPVIPQAGSGTRSTFLTKIGATEASMKEVGPEQGCVQVGQEHDTRFLADGTTAFPANAVTPMSAAQWVAQNTGAGENRIGAGVKVGTPVAGTAPVTGTGATMVPNAAFYSTTWGRETYIVVENARVIVGNAKYDAKLADLVSSATDRLGNNAAALPGQAGSVKKKFGFLPSTAVPFTVAKTS